MLLIKTDGAESTKETMTLEEMQAWVGGYVQMVPLPDGRELWCNEEGKIDGLPVNAKATAIWEKNYGPTDIIMGNAIISTPGEIK